VANITFSRKTFEKEIGKLDKVMQENIALFGTTLEQFNEDEIELEVFPNRPDLLSYHGFKRSFLAFLGNTKGVKSYEALPPEKDFKVIIDSSVSKIRPYTACAIVKGLSLNDERIKEIIDLQEKLHTTLGRKRKKAAIGVYPLEHITLPITYKAVEGDKIHFQPLEVQREMSGLEILQKHPTGKEYASLLAGKSKFPLFVDSKKNILSMPPIINSESTGRVSTSTRDVFVECSGFDFSLLKACLNIVVCALSDMGGVIYQMRLEYSKKEVTPDFSLSEKKISLEHINALLGISLSEKELKQYLLKMGHSYAKGIVSSPSYRVDLLHEVDYAEDVAIAYGYGNFDPVVPAISTTGKESSTELFKKKIAEILVGLGLMEVSNYHLTRKKDQCLLMGVAPQKEKGIIEVKESKTDRKILRNDLSHFLLKNFSENVDSEYPQHIFEVGKVFLDKGAIQEEEQLSLGITPGNFTQAKQMVEYLFSMLGKDVSFVESSKLPLYGIGGRAADIVFEKKVIGQLGEVHPKILKNWKLKMPAVLCEINLEKLMES